MNAPDSPEAFARAFDVSRETLERFRAYESLLRKWNRSINLVAPGTLAAVWQRHFADSAQLLALAPGSARRWIDLGSGAGFPGLVVALLAAGAGRALEVSLVESDGRKAAFLETAARETGAPVRILAARAEALPPAPHDVVSARALAQLAELLALAAPLLAPEGMALLPRGARWEGELTAARRHWHYAARAVPSLTDPAARILCLTEVRRAE